MDPARTDEQRTAALQMLLEVADALAVSMDDLRVPAAGAKFRVDTGDATPIK